MNNEKPQVILYINKKRLVLEFEEKSRIAGALGSGTAPESCAYTLGRKQFTGEEPLKGNPVEVLADAGGDYIAIKQDRFGDKTLYVHESIPTFDSEDREWDSYQRYALIYDGRQVHAIAIRGGYKIARIELYRKLTSASAEFKPYFEKLGYPESVSNYIQWIGAE